LLERIQLFPMFVSNVADIFEPLIAQAETAVFQSCFNATTPKMTANNDVPNAQHIDSILNHRKTVHIIQRDNIRNITVNKKFTRQKSDDFVGRDSTIGAADP